MWKHCSCTRQCQATLTIPLPCLLFATPRLLPLLQSFLPLPLNFASPPLLLPLVPPFPLPLHLLHPHSLQIPLPLLLPQLVPLPSLLMHTRVLSPSICSLTIRSTQFLLMSRVVDWYEVHIERRREGAERRKMTVIYERREESKIFNSQTHK